MQSFGSKGTYDLAAGSNILHVTNAYILEIISRVIEMPVS